jgi:multidrug efflux pump subunit AcrA (membrane-fusion protein)
VNLLYERDQLTRFRSLSGSQAVSTSELLTQEQVFRVAQEQVTLAEAELSLLKAGAWSLDKDVARAAVAQAQAQVDRVTTELERLQVRAPINGTILQVNLRVGEYVNSPSAQPLVVIADVSQWHVRVRIDEHDIPRFRAEAPGRAFLRGLSDRALGLKFIYVEPLLTTNRALRGETPEIIDTRVLEAVYLVEATDLTLYAGQEMDVFLE